MFELLALELDLVTSAGMRSIDANCVYGEEAL